MVSVVETIDKPFQSNEDNITSTINLLESIHKYVPNIKVFLRFLCRYGRLEDLPKLLNPKLILYRHMSFRNMQAKGTQNLS